MVLAEEPGTLEFGVAFSYFSYKTIILHYTFWGHQIPEIFLHVNIQEMFKVHNQSMCNTI